MQQTLELFHPRAHGLGQFFSELFDCQLSATDEANRVVLDLPDFAEARVTWAFNSNCTAKNQSRALTLQLNVVGNIFATFDELHQKLEFLRYKNSEFASLFQLQLDRKFNILSLSLGQSVIVQLV